MFIRLMSDLHLEFGNPFVPPADSDSVLILAGDISNGLGVVGWLDVIKANYKHVIYLAGNHEFYGDNLTDLQRILYNTYEDDDKVTFLNNSEVIIEDVRFIGGTLWTDFKNYDPFVMSNARNCMSDYQQIKNGGGFRRLTVQDIVKEHERTLNFITEKLDTPFNGKTVVVTHHGPSYRSVHSKYWSSSLNHYFVSELDSLIEHFQPDYWLHGHTHESMNYSIGATKIITNPFGYHNYEINSKFNPNLVLDI